MPEDAVACGFPTSGRADNHHSEAHVEGVKKLDHLGGECGYVLKT